MSTISPVQIAVRRAAKNLQLRPFKRITVKFDPFHKNVTPIRDFLHQVSALRVRQTNPDCVLKTDVVCDRSDPSIELTLLDGHRVIIRTDYLTNLEVLETMNKVATTHDVVKE
ncbi:39S ribosomal protein L53, mitochondrial [Ixodes scapularis]|uniref:39S ribosomal protein L53, mitochondrial n=1 Tax=Ixodes scapularis TaxID=6945 RepID=UPI0011616327|nr:39S ribosomal protein L53, mitochondrial [Ixodes scapularis]